MIFLLIKSTKLHFFSFSDQFNQDWLLHSCFKDWKKINGRLQMGKHSRRKCITMNHADVFLLSQYPSLAFYLHSMRKKLQANPWSGYYAFYPWYEPYFNGIRLILLDHLLKIHLLQAIRSYGVHIAQILAGYVCSLLYLYIPSLVTI